jgi:outer membrane biosynthesis protein TonB
MSCCQFLGYALAIVLFSTAGESFAQVASSSNTAEDRIVLTKLFPPAYPQLARASRITGEVEVTLGIGADGSVGS